MGYGLTRRRDKFEQQRLEHGHLRALLGEVLYCAGLAEGYLGSDATLPAYRAPTLVYQNSFPAVAGLMSPNETTAILQLYVNVEAFNRCLDSDDHRRARMKAEIFAPGKNGAVTAYDNAYKALVAHLPPTAVAESKPSKGELS
jgi:hypothetical protein